MSTPLGNGFAVTRQPHPSGDHMWLTWNEVVHHGEDDYERIEREVEIPAEIIPALVAQLIEVHASHYPKRVDEMHHALRAAARAAAYAAHGGRLRVDLELAPPSYPDA